MPKTPKALGDLEHEIVQLIWKGGPMTAAAVRKRLPRPLKDPTVRTVLRRLEEKGYLTHTVEAGTFMYHAKESREQIAVKAVKKIIDSFCDGSAEKMLVGLLNSALVKPSQLRAIAARMKNRAKT